MGAVGSSIPFHGFSWPYGSCGGETEFQNLVNGLFNTKIYNTLGILIAREIPTSTISAMFDFSKHCRHEKEKYCSHLDQDITFLFK